MSANSRMLLPSGQLSYCGAVIWRDKYSLGVSGGHADSYDDGHYAQDLRTGNWEMLLPPSTQGTPSHAADAYGEWLPGRPAAQHSGYHQVTVDDDIVLAYSYSIGYMGSGSGQAHRWNGAAGAWERYGNLRTAAPIVHTAIHDKRRNRIVLFEAQTTSKVHVIAAKNPVASWSSIGMRSFSTAGLYQSVGYHAALDCFVLVDQHTAANRVWVLDPDAIANGWVEVAVHGSAPTPMTWAGLEYVPPLQLFVSANVAEADALYYLAPKAGRFDSWAWYRESFTGPSAAWESSRGTPNSPQTRVKWSQLLNGLVIAKSPLALTEIFTPSGLAR